MKLWHSEYQLYPKGSMQRSARSSFRRGTLLRVEFEPGLVGYADMCPHSAFGDQPLEIEIQNLGRELLSPLAKRSLYFARMDAEARSEKRSLYGTQRIQNHYLISNLLEFDLNQIPVLQGQRFECFKVKLGRSLMLETEMLRELCSKLSPNSKVRLDFNCSQGREDFDRWLDQNAAELKLHIDFIEDPFQYDRAEWAKLSEKYDIDFAVDYTGPNFDSQVAGAQVIVIKPATQDEQEMIKALGESQHRIVFTHYLDFPVGQMFAYVTAQKLMESGEKRMGICGLQHHNFYESYHFQELIKNDGPFIVPPKGYGIGFDEALEAQSWKALR